MVSTQISDLLADLRCVDAGADWNVARAAAVELFLRLTAAEALALAHAEVEQRLPMFAAHHPGADGPRRLLVRLAAAQMPIGDDADPELIEYEGPGGNSFNAGLAALIRGLRADDAEARAQAFVDAIAQAIMTESIADWGSRFPAQWRRWYAAAELGEDASDVLCAMTRDPKYRAIVRTGWARLADELEKQLGDAPTS